MTLFDPGILAIISSLIAIVIILATTFGAVNLAFAHNRIPEAARFVDIAERRKLAEEKLGERLRELRSIEQQISEHGRAVAEVSSLLEQRDNLLVELNGLNSARQQIDEVKREAAQAAAEFAEHKQGLDAISSEHRRLSDECSDIQSSIKALEDEKASLIPEVEQFRSEFAALQQQVEPLRVQRDEAYRTIEQAERYRRDIATGEDRLREIEEQKVKSRADLEKFTDEFAILQQQAEPLRVERSEAHRVIEQAARCRDDIKAAGDRVRDLETEIMRLEQTRSTKQGEIGAIEAQVQDLDRRRSEARARIERLQEQESDHEANIARLQATAARIECENGSASGSTPIDESSVRESFQGQLLCLSDPRTLRPKGRLEEDALSEVDQYLVGNDLKYSRRTIRAFHTALKINDKAQMTVLAGVSGTGKSLLPRKYAEAMGLHFLQIAVEPRWDSPQDLLGFYNYIEKNYRATDLAKLLAQIDPYNSAGLERPFEPDHMSLVLLDEMNLARVEYYFSEFLSRLESRPQYADVKDEPRRKDSLIPIDIRGLSKPIHLFPSHNVLFAGTMNDDESTQALSDKVLDRGNVLQFPAPLFDKADDRPKPKTNIVKPEALRFTQWRAWVKTHDFLPADDLSFVQDTVRDLAKIMDEIGRPFGHRLRDAIMAYVANYPKDGTSPHVNHALADQIEFRILPKLRGIQIDQNVARFDQIEKLVGERLKDTDLADRIHKLREEQTGMSGLFVWRGLRRDV